MVIFVLEPTTDLEIYTNSRWSLRWPANLERMKNLKNFIMFWGDFFFVFQLSSTDDPLSVRGGGNIYLIATELNTTYT